MNELLVEFIVRYTKALKEAFYKELTKIKFQRSSFFLSVYVSVIIQEHEPIELKFF